jgi:hypothetical protein
MAVEISGEENACNRWPGRKNAGKTIISCEAMNSDTVIMQHVGHNMTDRPILDQPGPLGVSLTDWSWFGRLTLRLNIHEKKSS